MSFVDSDGNINRKDIVEYFESYDKVNKPTYIKFDKFAVINNKAFKLLFTLMDWLEGENWLEGEK